MVKKVRKTKYAYGTKGEFASKDERRLAQKIARRLKRKKAKK